MRSQPYKIGLDERLKDPAYAAAYISAAKKESNEVFLLALRDVAEVHKIGKVAKAAEVNRETLYRTLSARGNPTAKTLTKILRVLGIGEDYVPLAVKQARKRVIKSTRKIVRLFGAHDANQGGLRSSPSIVPPQGEASANFLGYFAPASGGQAKSSPLAAYPNQKEVPPAFLCDQLIARTNGIGQGSVGRQIGFGN